MVMTAQDTKLKPGYKQTEVGVIPEDWDIVELGNVIDYTKGFAFKSDDYQSDGIRIIRVSDTTFESIKNVNQIYIDRDKAYLYDKWALKEHDLILSTVGSKPPMYDSMVGKAIIIEKQYDGALLNQNAVLIRSKKRKSHKQKLLLNHFRTKRYLTYVESIFRGNANQASITLNDLFHFQLALPSNDAEQQAIAAALSDIDALITSLDKLIVKKRDIKRATMQQLLTGRARLPGFSGDGSAKLGDFFDLNPGKPSLNDTDLVTFIRMEGVSESGRIINQNVLPLSSIKKGFTYFERNDVLVAKITPCFENGKGACLDTIETKSGFGSTEFHILRAQKNAIPRYIFYQTQTVEFRRQLETEMIGTAGQKRVPARAIIDYPLPVFHSKDEQQAIATILSDMDTEITILEQKREKTRALKQGMMQELLTGKTRLL